MYALKLEQSDQLAKQELSIVHKFPDKTGLDNAGDRDMILDMALRGKTVREISEETQLPIRYLNEICRRYGVSLNSNRPYTDIEITFGIRSSMRADKSPSGFKLYDEDTKANFSLLIEKYTHVIKWVISKSDFKPKDGDWSEVIQVVRIMLYYRYRNYSPHKMKFVSWLMTTTRYIISQYREALKHGGSREFYYETLNENLAAGSLEEYKEDPAISALNRAIADLPEKFQKVIRLHLDGLGNKAIAQRLGLSQGSVATTIMNIRQSIFEYRDRWFTPDIQTRTARLNNSSLQSRRCRNLYDFGMPKARPKKVGNISDLSDEQIEELKGHLKVNSVADTARIMGFSDNKLRGIVNRLSKAGIIQTSAIKKDVSHALKLTPEKREQMHELLKNHSRAEVAKMLNVTYRTVWLTLKKEAQ